MQYFVINLMNKEWWEGEAETAKEAYQYINIKAGDTTSMKYGRLSSVKEWKKDQRV